jgi:preprotein translocase subunit SecF
MITIIGKTDVDFVGKRYIGFALSTVLILLGIWGVIRVGRGTAKMAIDFAGGTSMTLVLEKNESVEAMRNALKADFPDAEILQVEDKPQYLIRIRSLSLATGKTGEKVAEVVAKAFPENAIKEKSSEEVGPAVSQKLRQQAFWAVAVAMFFITIYIAFRFDFHFAVGAFVATIHDVLAVLGIMVFFGRDFSLLIVTALLTLAGYSLTDTVVVFDRIRENMRLRRSDPFAKIINDSINETLSRTLNTSMTTLLVVVVLFFWGGEVVHDFALSLIMGIIVGTYSSIWVASPLVLEWNLRSPAKR